jgi:FlaA1/EpsC-like NDP-sugar epimerase
MSWTAGFLLGSGRYRRTIVVLVHAILVIGAYVAAYLFTAGFPLPAEESRWLFWSLPILLAVRLVIFRLLHVYEAVWIFVGTGDLITIFKATLLGSVVIGVPAVLLPSSPSPLLFVLDWILCSALVAGARLAVRLATERHARRIEEARRANSPRKRALIVGGGDGAVTLLRESHRNPRLDYDVVGLVDDDPTKRGRRIYGVKIVGAVAELPELVGSMSIDELLLAIPSGTAEQRRAVISKCLQCAVPLKTVPGLDELIRGKGIGDLREIDPADLLERQPVELDQGMVESEIRGKSVVITGAGGSIGSELCRQVAALGPDLIVLFERAESALHAISVELSEDYPNIKAVPVVGDIRDRAKVDEVVTAFSPDIVYHAAAYKHVHLMEVHPLEAIDNNIFGTESLAEVARGRGVPKFVLISTDKAVNPIGVMGMTKRIAENVLRARQEGPTTFVAVRFGNVLGSIGSVLPLFRKQIADGHALTVTDPQATRYFMLTSEAAQLVLQAGHVGNRGEVLFLDMGTPVRIMDLAERVVRLSGLAPGVDVPLEVVGLRAGERLSEELTQEGEQLIPTDHPQVLRLQANGFDPEAFDRELERLRRLLESRDELGATMQIREMANRF